MRLQVIDGTAVFATHIVHTQAERKELSALPLQVELDGIVCYSQEELVKAEQFLKERGLEYTVEELRHDPAYVAKAQGVKYASRSECIEHLLNGKEPESAIVPNLRKQLAEEQKRRGILEQELAVLKQSLKTKGVI